jgi:hypothetical protein
MVQSDARLALRFAGMCSQTRRTPAGNLLVSHVRWFRKKVLIGARESGIVQSCALISRFGSRVY